MMSSAVDYLPSFVILLREAYEGIPPGFDYTWFVQGQEGIFDALEKVSAEAASNRPGNANSIAAHIYHLAYALHLANADIQGIDIKSDWEGSWAKQTVTEEEWKELAAGLKREYEGVLRWFESDPPFTDRDAMTGSFAILPHSAYHLGAVRQLMKVV